jgi:uncharacterized membrane protein YesL
LALRLGLRDTYDALGAVLLLSLAVGAAVAMAGLGGQTLAAMLFSALPGSLPGLLSVAGGGLALALVGGPLAAGLFRYARNVAARQEPDLFDLGWGYRAALGRSLRLAGVQMLVGMVLAGDALFFLTRGQPVVVGLGAIFGYLCLFWCLMSLYAWPLLAEDETGRVRSVLRKSALLVLDNFPYTLLLALFLLVLSVLLWGTVIGGAILWAGSMAMFQTQATRELLRKYGVLGPDPTLDPISAEAER